MNVLPSKQNQQDTGIKRQELSLEQQLHEEQNKHDEKEPILDKKLDGPNRPSE